MLTVTIVPTANRKYDTYYNGELLGNFRTPLYSAARKLVELGVDPSETLGMARPGDTVSLSGRISVLAGRQVLENEKIGPVSRPYTGENPFGKKSY